MNITVEKYNSSNNLQFKLARILANKIKSIVNERPLDLVVDIGSGSGNVTAMFAENLNYKRLIGLNLDPEMVEFAKKNNQNKSIDFLQCDFEMPWDEKCEEVKLLQGKCSMIYSSTALHWMSKVDIVASNISKLLAPGSQLFIIMTDMSSTFFPSPEHANEYYSILPLFKGDKYITKWKEAFQSNQIRVDFAETVPVDQTVTANQQMKMWRPMGKALLKKYLPKNYDVDVLLEKFPEIGSNPKLMNYRPTGQLADDGNELWTKDYYYWVIVATKF